MEYNLILLAAGEGQRAALGYNKVLYRMGGKKELGTYALDFFKEDKECLKIVLVINKNDEAYIKALMRSYDDSKIVLTYGGNTRGESVFNGLKFVDSSYVMIHDAARPLLYKEDIINLKNACLEMGGATLATKVYNTTCHIVDGCVDEYFSRHTLASIITPQCFNTNKLKESYNNALKDGLNYTDDSSIFKAYGNAVKLCFTDNISIKATTIYDIKLLEVLLNANR